ncbi:MAG: type II toxin-antitoxin system prevent-host-death family antitoxin [Ilumatobacteraceae bacterium]
MSRSEAQVLRDGRPVERQHDPITVTRKGRPATVLMSADDLAAIKDSLKLLSDPTTMDDIVRGMASLPDWGR